MQKSSKHLVSIAIILLFILVAYVILKAPQPSDIEIINSQIEYARSAASHHDINGILHPVSEYYNDNTIGNVDRLHAVLIQVMRNAGPIKVDKMVANIIIHGDTADSISRVVIRNGQNEQIYFQGDISLHWKKEESKRWFIIPLHTWRVVNAEYPGSIWGGMDSY